MRYQVIAFGLGNVWDIHECRTRELARSEKAFHSILQERGVVYDFTQLLGGIRFIDRLLFPKIQIWDRQKKVKDKMELGGWIT